MDIYVYTGIWFLLFIILVMLYYMYDRDIK